MIANYYNEKLLNDLIIIELEYRNNLNKLSIYIKETSLLTG